MKRALLGILAVSALLITGLTSCEKVKDALAQKQIEGKWQMQSAIGNYTVLGENYRDTTYFTADDYVQFNADSTVTIHEDGETASGKWSLIDDKLHITETDYLDYPNGFEIRTLTNAKLELFYTEQNQIGTSEQTLILVK